MPTPDMGRVQPSIESLPAIADAEKLAAIAAVIEGKWWIGTDAIQNILVGAQPYNPTEGLQ